MPLETTLVYSEELICRAAFGFWRRSVGVGLPVALGCAFLFTGWLLWQGDRSWLVGVLAGGLALIGILVSAVYLIHYRQGMAKFRALEDHRATFIADDATFSVSSALGTTTFPWSTIQEVWRFPGFWLLLFSRSQFSTLPADCLTEEMQAFILNRVSAAGGKIS